MRRLPMRKIGDALRLKAAGLTTRKIAASLGIGQTTASEYLKRAERAGLSWPLPDGVSEADLEQRLFRPIGGETRRGLAPPDWPAVHRALKRKEVTLALVWEEYRAAHPDDGYGYSRFCELYRRWEGRLSPTMREHHFAGERAFVDYAGDTLEVVDGATGEVHQAQIFVGVLGASNCTYVEATWTQALPDWIGAHVRVLAFFGGAPGQLVSDSEGRSAPPVRAPPRARPGSRRPASTSLRSTGPMPTSLRTTTPQSSRRVRTGPATRPRSRSACSWCSAGSWPGCVGGASSLWPS
jgi:transposase